jgi:hypothetical protein
MAMFDLFTKRKSTVCEHSITLKRDEMKGFLSTQSIGTEALNALHAIPGVGKAKVVSESNEQVELTYSWVGDGKFWEIDEHLAEFGLARVDVKLLGAPLAF